MFKSHDLSCSHFTRCSRMLTFLRHWLTGKISHWKINCFYFIWRSEINPPCFASLPQLEFTVAGNIDYKHSSLYGNYGENKNETNEFMIFIQIITIHFNHKSAGESF